MPCAELYVMVGLWLCLFQVLKRCQVVGFRVVLQFRPAAVTPDSSIPLLLFFKQDPRWVLIG